MSYSFKTDSTAQIKLFLSTEYGYRGCDNGRFHDGELVGMVSDQGKIHNIMVTPKKEVHLQENHGCRKRPYLEEFTEYFLQNLNTECPKPCKGWYYLFDCNGLYLSEKVRQLPICPSDSYQSLESQCFYRVLKITLGNVTKKPCTSLQYSFQNYPVNYIPEDMAQSTSFAIAFDSPVTVKEEYLICDMVTLIGAVGGTMGLFIGFSFTDMANSILKLIQKLIVRVRTNHDKVDTIFVREEKEEIKLSHVEIVKSISTLEARMSTYEEANSISKLESRMSTYEKELIEWRKNRTALSNKS